MDETITTTDGVPRALTGTDDAASTAQQPALPLLSFEDDADQPIGYTLTARARREVVPHTVPELRIVDPAGAPDDADADLDRPGDTRPSRARALRRAGASLAQIAAELEVDELVVRAWVGDVGARLGRQRLAAHVAARAGSLGAPDAPEGSGRDGARERDDLRAAFQLARAAAVDDGRERLRDPAFAAGLGLVSSLLTVDEHAATITTSRLEVAAAAVRWLRTHAGLGEIGLRVVLRLGPDVAGDLARHRWADALGLPTDRVLHTRWRGAPAGDAVEALVRVPDGTWAAALAGWRDALLTDPDPPTAHGTGF